MIDNLNYIISNGDSFRHYYNDGEECELFKLDFIEHLEWKKTFLQSYHNQIATLNSDSKNIYFVNVNNIDSVDFTSGDSFFVINFIDETSLRISFINSNQAIHNNVYLSSAIFSRDILEYISTKTKLYVHQDNIQNIPNNIFNNLQTAIDNQLPDEVIIIQEGGICSNSNVWFEVTKSVIIYCESDVTINETFRVRPTIIDQDVRIYGNPILNGDIIYYNILSDSDMNIHIEVESSLNVGGACSNFGNSYISVKANNINLTGNGFDTDSYISSFDIDSINVTVADKFTYMSNTGIESLYFRNFNSIGDVGEIKLGETGGQYILNLISCSMDESYIYFIDDSNNQVNLWNSFFITEQSNSIINDSGGITYISLYGKNGSNKPADSNSILSGVGQLKIQTALELV
jgi:hypothetical protein